MERGTSFGAYADDYDELRPPMSPDAVRWVVPESAAVAVDLGAGTGAMTRALLPLVPTVIPVEPDARMRSVLERRTPGVSAVDGRGEALPLPDASVDLVVVASAWHWMDNDDTVREIARVLRDGGRFAVVWTTRDVEAQWMTDLLHGLQLEADAKRAADHHIRTPDLTGAPFTAAESAEFRYTHRTSVDVTARSVGTFSGVIARGPEGVAAAVEHTRAALTELFGADGEFDLALRTIGHRCDRLPRRAR